MPRRSDTTDRRPGAMPDIRADGDHIVFEFPVAIGARDVHPRRLVLRCTQDGDVLAAIHPYQDINP
jgi:hypothetical protein